MPFTISKTDYILYRECHKDAWFKVHQPQLYFAKELSEFAQALIETGNEVELVARKLFPDGVLVEDRHEIGQKFTQQYLAEHTPTIFQAVFEKDGFMAALDVLQYVPETNSYIVTEVKATNEIKVKDHLPDLAYQVNLLKKCGLAVSGVKLIHLNPEYVRQGELNLSQLFAIEDVTKEVFEMLPEVLVEMETAFKYLSGDAEPAGNCDCIYKGRSNHCTMFAHSNPNMAAYGVHDLTRIGASKKKLIDLIDSGVYTIDDIPEDFKLTDKQQNQVDVYKADAAMIDQNAIAAELDKLVFPLYFFDYETYPCAIPRFDGYSTYTQIPFQYSLHILESADAEPTHKEFLYVGMEDPSFDLLDSLMKDIGPSGSVLAWHKSFEQGRNTEIGNRIPKGKAFMEDLNNRMYDLEDIFTAQMLVHPGFKGKTSIKYVLPTLVPKLSYKELAIKEGGTASQEWNKIATNAVGEEEKMTIAANLRTYCELDTMAMLEIWRYLNAL